MLSKSAAVQTVSVSTLVDLTLGALRLPGVTVLARSAIVSGQKKTQIATGQTFLQSLLIV
ncbi:MAG: hypothetical protein WBL95_22130 [Microcoleus sp.]